ncbi:hypothetical protein [Rubrivirga sp. IMCC45206]|uniref:hypothetical protein n=1 Tax=Rubrivirga sp. IMCC45206 TaxID=3391614 RepID=UPI00398FAAEF
MTDSLPPDLPTDAPASPPLRRRLGLSEWADLAQIAGTVAVLVSLVYVGVQLRQATDQLERQESNATQSQWQAIRLLIAGDRDAARVWTEGLAGDSLDAVDAARFDRLLEEHAWATVHIWDRTRRGLFEAANFQRSAAPPLARWLCTPGGGPWWTARRDRYPAGFVEAMGTAMGRLAEAEGPACPVR